MICNASEVEIQTIIDRINNKDMILQPEFQRGDIWSENKKKKLIDSILRGWKIPPIHVVQADCEIDEVLDGQQRLTSIYNFINGEFSIDGTIKPIDKKIEELNNKYFCNLSDEIKRKIRKYSITIIRLTDYQAQEPAELFYRLNQPVALTAAEQRNAYIGKTRSQIKNLVKEFCDKGANRESVGFSNSRLAYDEIISKYCYCVELGTLSKKITATDVSERYRNDIYFENETIEFVSEVLDRYLKIVKALYYNRSYTAKLSKATLYSWLIFLGEHMDYSLNQMVELVFCFESLRDYLKGKLNKIQIEDEYKNYDNLLKEYSFLEIMMNIYNQRSSMGSTDSLSIIYRDIIINIFSQIVLKDQNDYLLKYTIEVLNEEENMNYVLDSVKKKFNWGEIY